MKKYIILSISLLLVSLSLMAGPAYPGRIVVTQPDGTKIGIWMHGDEFCSWVTDDTGRILQQDADGFWRVSDMTSSQLQAKQEEASRIRAEINAIRLSEAKNAPSQNFGSPKIPVLLIGFSDREIYRQREEFEALLNQVGYSENGAIGSVFDYFNDNSFGAFTPQFEVLGPVQVSNDMAYYGAPTETENDIQPERLLVDGASLLDETVDFSRYDNDGDGRVDFVIFYYAGYDQAQGGGDNCIWSHAWYLSYSPFVTAAERTFDGVKLDRYFCTAELIGTKDRLDDQGNEKKELCHIGTTCHEFAHTLGLPDFYDTDYATNGSAASMYRFDIMASGSYNGLLSRDSTRPPYFNAEELEEIGWLDAIPELVATGDVSLPSVNYPGATAYSAYKINTENPGEYFVFETRGGQRWDAPLPTGMMVYHVDKSSNIVIGDKTADYLWSRNRLNAYAVHPCCYVVPAHEPYLTDLYDYSNLDEFFFPGSFNEVTYLPKAWSGSDFGMQLTNIQYDGNGTTQFRLTNSNEKGIYGRVVNTDGDPISGVTISASLLNGAQPSPAPASKPEKNRIFRRSSVVATTDANGMYSINLEEGGDYLVVASRAGYQQKSATVTVVRVETCSFCLLHEEEQLPQEVVLYPAGSEFANYYGGEPQSSWDVLYANRYRYTTLQSYVGKHVKYISFMAGGSAIEDCHVVLDFVQGSSSGNVFTRKLALPLDSQDVQLNQWTTINVSDKDIIIPAATDIFVGWGGHVTGNYPFWATSVDNLESGVAFVGDFSLATIGTPGWLYYYSGLVHAIKITIGEFFAPDTGYNYIADPRYGAYNAGDTFNLTLVETEGVRKPGTAVSWFMDDEPVYESTVTLTAGYHLIEARFFTTEGKKKVVELELDVAP